MRSRRPLVVGAFVCVALLAAVLWLAIDDEATPTTPSVLATSATPDPSPAQPVEDIGEPTRLELASIELDAPVIPVGTTLDNAQDVPRSLDDTGWWEDGQRPGEPGNAVIVGHTSAKSDGVFDRLVDVVEGDEIVVEADGGSLTYRVTRTETVDVEDFAEVAPEVYRDRGTSGLVLMTCGDFDGARFLTTVIVHAEVTG